MSQFYMLPEQLQYISDGTIQAATPDVSVIAAPSQSMTTKQNSLLPALMMALGGVNQLNTQPQNVTIDNNSQATSTPQTSTASYTMAPEATRGSAQNPMWADNQFGQGMSDKFLGISALLGTLAGSSVNPRDESIWGSLGRAGGAMSGMAKGEMASRNMQDQRMQQFQHNQQLMDLYRALISSRQGGPK